jgi:hypothetical protein
VQQVQAASRRLAEATGNRLVALWSLVESGDLTTARFRQLASAAVASANMQGVSLADLGLTAEITRQLGRRAAPLGLLPTRTQTDQARIARNIDDIIGSTPASATSAADLSESRKARLHRLGRSEPLLTVATAVQTGMARRDARGWTRGLSGGSCPLCVGWADGVVRSTETRMVRHVGCDCIQSPVF